MQDIFWTSVVILAYAGAVIFWAESEHRDPTQTHGLVGRAVLAVDEPIQPIPRSIPVDPARRDLGERLFHDPRLSGPGTFSCASCHDLSRGGDDGVAHGVGASGARLAVNVPTVLNSGLSFRQFWDGRVASLEEQVDGPLLAPEEMGATWEGVIERLTADPEYLAAFQRVFGSAPTPDGVRIALASFERSLVTPDARFDRYLRGEADALSETEREGYRLFKEYGCIGCHQGMTVGGNMYQRLGIVRDYFEDRGDVTQADLGRFNVTGLESDKHVFKVPSLRNVALTAPYFHDGSAATLEDAIRVMGRYQLGREIPEKDAATIRAFLETLTGELGTAS